MKYTQQIFEKLSRGRFISSICVNSTDRYIYIDLCDNKEKYMDYFSKIGFSLEEGDGYFYFSRKESKTSLSEKLKKFGHWIDIIDFIKTYEPSACPGLTFTLPQLAVRVESDIELREKCKMLYDNKGCSVDIIAKLADELSSNGFIELYDDGTQKYQITSAFRYLEDMVNLLEISEEYEILE